MSTKLTHLDARGHAAMVDVSEKDVTSRLAGCSRRGADGVVDTGRNPRWRCT